MRVQILMNWASATYVWFRVVRECGLELVEDRAAALSDVFHSLGASRFGLLASVPLSFGMAVYDKRWASSSVVYEFVAGMLFIVFVAGILKVLNSARRSTQYSLLDLYRNFITALAPRIYAGK